MVILQDDLRVELELDPVLPAVLLMGGGEGMGPVKKTAKALAESLFDKENGKALGQMIIICGRNKALASSLESLEWKIPVKVKIKNKNSVAFDFYIAMHFHYYKFEK